MEEPKSYNESPLTPEEMAEHKTLTWLSNATPEQQARLRELQGKMDAGKNGATEGQPLTPDEVQEHRILTYSKEMTPEQQARLRELQGKMDRAGNGK